MLFYFTMGQVLSYTHVHVLIMIIATIDIWLLMLKNIQFVVFGD